MQPAHNMPGACAFLPMLYIFILIILLICAYKIISWFPLSFPKFHLQPSSLSIWYGAPGSGKSTVAAFFALKGLASGVPVYSNMPIKGTYYFNKNDIGRYLIENCLVLIDEAGVDYNSRNFKSNFTPDQIKWFKYHRHERAQVMIFSQGFDDMDKILRTLGTEMYVVRKGFFRTITYRRIRKRPDIDEITHKPDDLYSFEPFSKRRIFAPAVWHAFDSFSRLGLPEKEFPLWGQDNNSQEKEDPFPPDLEDRRSEG